MNGDSTLPITDPEPTRTQPLNGPAPTVPTPESHPSDPKSQHWLPGEILLEYYVIEKKLGQGGMAMVHLVRRKTDQTLFAVKTLLTSTLQDRKRKREFLRELRTWIDLPNHPNLTACRFFRTIDDRLAIFSEFVDGGSLHEWIADRKLTQLSRILEVAVEFAWGLHAAHVCGVVHQDVKPANVLMSSSGHVKVTDFGLSRALQSATPIDPDNVDETTSLVSSNGMTIAYCSPEQSSGKKLGFQTDIWSWGVSVLEMFVGRVTWTFGFAAPGILEAYRENGSKSDIDRMPDAVAEILNRCFQIKPSDRWHSMLEIADALIQVYSDELNRPFPFPTPEFKIKAARNVRLDRSSTTNVQWRNPRIFLERAIKANGGDVSEAELMIPNPGGSIKAQALADLEVFGEAEQLLNNIESMDLRNKIGNIGDLLMNKAVAQQFVDDFSGALRSYDRVIEIAGAFTINRFDEQILDMVATASINKAIILSGLKKYEDAIAAYDLAEEIWYDLIYDKGKEFWYYSLGLVYLNKAIIKRTSGSLIESVELFEKALQIFERLQREKKAEIPSETAITYMNSAESLRMTGALSRGLKHAEKAVALLIDLVETQKIMKHLLASAYQVKADCLMDLSNISEAQKFYSRNIILLEKCVFEDDRHDLREKLAVAYLKQAKAMDKQHRDSEPFFNKALEILDSLIRMEGRTELVPQMIDARIERAGHYLRTGSLQKAEMDAKTVDDTFKTDEFGTVSAELKKAFEKLKAELNTAKKRIDGIPGQRS